MLETVRRLKVNKVYEGETCRWCGNPLALGEDGAICENCHSPHHARCWDQQNGCNGDTSCVNRPLQQLAGVAATATAAPRPARQLNPGESYCPICGDVVSGVCFRCRQPIAGGEFSGVKETAPEAKEALKFAIIGLFCFGIILGPLAIVKGASAKRTIAMDPRYEGEGIATAAQIIGGIEVGLFVLYIFAAVMGGGRP
ncbi:MAG TPA: DUF4190 domain-containing protein [Pyrinomonadaceae bacterium]|nr:DUF4190 domain-containing protein [Pyrinomonadaceae bacterium]